MINNLYNDTKPKRTNLRIQTEKDEYLKFHVLKKMKNQQNSRIPKFLNVSVNGNKIVNHISSNFKSLQVPNKYVKDKYDISSMENTASKGINLKQYIYRKYVTEASDYQINNSYDINPQIERLVRLRKIFNQKYRNRSSCDQKSFLEDKKMKKKDISGIIRVTNPDIYASTFGRKFQKQDNIKQQILNRKKPQIKYKTKQKNRQKDLLKPLYETPILLQPWQTD